ncbi:MAG TPA: hypothetical protein VF941_06555 [Clostridia bacterium]
MRNPEQWRKRRKLAYGAVALGTLAIDALVAYSNIKAFETGNFQREPGTFIALDAIILGMNAVVGFAYRHYYHGNRSNILGGYDDIPSTIRQRSEEFFRPRRLGDRSDRDYPNRDIRN